MHGSEIGAFIDMLRELFLHDVYLLLATLFMPLQSSQSQSRMKSAVNILFILCATLLSRPIITFIVRHKAGIMHESML